ncbi:MAG: twin-arginine translocase TatA/TatE family subunit [Deltaproteobacteria bacterium]|nr:twin-arginine translocase TatA/TatE family subunit [Deltaproteobacteria bacterium]
MFGLSFTEVGIVGVLALLLLGPDQLPQMAKSLGKWIRELRKTGDDLRRTLETEMVKFDSHIDVDVNPTRPRAAPMAVPSPPKAVELAKVGAAANTNGAAGTSGASAGAGSATSDIHGTQVFGDASIANAPEGELPPWMNLPERPTPQPSAAAEEYVPLDQRSARESYRKKLGPALDGPEPEAKDPASKRARLRKAAAPKPPAAARAQLRARASQPPPVAESPAPEAIPATPPEGIAS